MCPREEAGYFKVLREPFDGVAEAVETLPREVGAVAALVDPYAMARCELRLAGDVVVDETGFLGA